MTPRLLKAEDVALLIRVQPRTVMKWAASKKIPCIRVHGCLRFREADVAHWLDEATPNGLAR